MLQIETYRKFARLRIDAVNHALAGVPEERARYHLYWGSWHGPHTWYSLKMKWSSQPGASTGTKASSTLAPERSIPAFKVSSW
jgi:hypothetical protein